MTYDDLNVMSLEYGKGNHSKWPHFSAVLGFVRITSIVMLNPRKKDQKGLDAAN